jgi:FkbM family methyltransferase
MPVLNNVLNRVPYKDAVKMLLFRPGEQERPVLAGELKGLRFHFDLRHDTQMWRGVYEQSLQRWLREYVEPGSICLDIGAAAGYFTILLAKLSGPDGVVYAFEPSELHERITDHVELNRQNFPLATVSVYDRFVTANPAHQQSSSCVSVDQVVCDASLNRVDVIKIDVDGAEADVLRGAHQTLERFHPHLCVEVHSRNLLNEVRHIASRYGYALRLEDAAPHEHRPIEYNAFLFSKGRTTTPPY